MKLDTSGLESPASVRGISHGLPSDALQMTPSFEIPNTANVSYAVPIVLNLFDCLYAIFWCPPNNAVALLLQFDSFQKDAIQMVKPAKGTTTLAFIFKQGVIVAADSRASMGGYICTLLYKC